MNLGHHVGLLHQAERDLADAHREVGRAHQDEPDVLHITERLAAQCDRHAEVLAPFVERYGEDADDEPDRLRAQLFEGARSGGYGLLRDLLDLYLLASTCDIAWTLLGQAAQGVRDDDMLAAVHACEGEITVQLRWITTRMKQAAPQALVVT